MTTIVSVEEQLRGWLARIAKISDPHRQIDAYTELSERVSFLASFTLLPWDMSAPSHGYLRWTGAAQEGCANLQEATERPASSVDAGMEEVDDIEPVVRPEKEIGSGTECVYLYFNPNDRELAWTQRSRCIGECKIGRTSNCDAIPEF